MVPRLPGYLNKLVSKAVTEMATGDGILIPRLTLAPASGLRSRLSNLIGRFLSPPSTSPKSVLIIGVHGWFPTRILQQFVGIPTGTSTRLSTMMEEAMQREASEIKIERVAVEGDGSVHERLALHWEQLKEHRGKLKNYDQIVLIGHSQGVPVALLLASKLAELLRPEQRISLVGLAGVLGGARLSLPADLPAGSAPGIGQATRELFEMARPSSEIAQTIDKALIALLQRGSRMALIAGLMDPVVPLSSSLRPNISSDLIWRSIYTQKSTTDPILLAMINLILVMLQRQHPEASLLLEAIHEFTAGSIYSQRRAHSALHADPNVYTVAARWILQPHPVKSEATLAELGKASRYHVPWILRGLKGNKDKEIQQCLLELERAMESQRNASSDLWRILSPILRGKPQSKL